jgi:IS4 transposase
LVRTSKITPAIFLDLLFYGIDREVKSLSRISQTAYNDHYLTVSKQGINDRFSPSSVDFVKVLLKEAIASQVTTTINQSELQLFNTVRIKDSTTFEVHDSLAQIFEGFGKGGGPNSKAGISIQYEFDIKNNKVFEIDIKAATQNDSRDAIAKKESIQKGDLIIRDLGYYSDDIIAHFLTKKAFFISKLYHNVSVRLNQDDRKKVDFLAIYRDMINTRKTHLDLNVFIGKKKRPVRLIAVLMPEDVYQKRVNRVNKDNKSRGYTISDEFKSRAHFNFIICNIPDTQCSWETICNLYRVRWQIELVFKIWKSIMKIDKLPKLRSDRMLTTLYSKLLWILINWQIVSDCRNYFYKTKSRLLSISKCFKTLTEKTIQLRDGLLNFRLERTLFEFIYILRENHWSEKRKNRQNFEEIIDLIFCKSNI